MAEAAAITPSPRQRAPQPCRCVAAIIAIAALFAPLFAPHDPLAQDLMLRRLPPFWIKGSEPGYWLGTDSLGRDVLSRLIYAARIALTVALVAAPGTCIVGSILGLVAGYSGASPTDDSRVVDIWMAFPPVLFCILLVAVLGTGLYSVIIALVVIDWIRFSRVCQGRNSQSEPHGLCRQRPRRG